MFDFVLTLLVFPSAMVVRTSISVTSIIGCQPYWDDEREIECSSFTEHLNWTFSLLYNQLIQI